MFDVYGYGINSSVSVPDFAFYMPIDSQYLKNGLRGNFENQATFINYINHLIATEKEISEVTGKRSCIIIPEDILKSLQRTFHYAGVLESKGFEYQYVQFRNPDKSKLPFVKMAFVYMPKR